MLALTTRGLARAEAHERLRALTARPGEGPSLAERAKADATVRRLLRPEEIDQLLDPESYVRASTAKTDRVLARIEPELGR